MKYIMLIPFKKNEASSDYKPGSIKVDSFSSKEMEKIYSDVVYNLGVKPPLDTDNTSDITVYIRGHSSKGSDKVTSKQVGGKSATVQEVFDLLKKIGMKSGFSGRIKCYNCYSSIDSGTNLSFAARLDSLLRKDGAYTSCDVYGYSEAIGGSTKTASADKALKKDKDRLKRMKNNNPNGDKDKMIEDLEAEIAKEHRWISIQSQSIKKRSATHTNRVSNFKYKYVDGKPVLNPLNNDKK